MKSIHLRQTLPQVFADRNSITSDIWHKNVVFSKGEMYLIEAASGTGKSSLCSYIYGYRNDYQGIINFDETNIKAYSVEQWVNLRKHSLSMLFQDLRLVYRTDGTRKHPAEEQPDRLQEKKGDPRTFRNNGYYRQRLI
ncbi:ATP-binding cassette domain-containing protein [Bacteroides salyersiae]|nr:ATP-binding cassette domain-containing protein [Bacteroides salyersiae]